MAVKKKLQVDHIAVSVITQGGDDYISLTDMAKHKNKDTTGIIISNWLSTKYTIQFMGAWERVHNPHFNVMEFDNIRNEAGSNAFILSSSRWITATKAIGLRSSTGRYGGTYAHKDIAFEFATWLSPEFKLYLIKEFQRLKQEEIQRKELQWDLKRNLAAVNYRIHTDAIQKHLVPAQVSQQAASLTYASEADVLNMALFGQTAKEWREANSKLDGNIRDYATAAQLVCLSNLESLNAEWIAEGLKQSERLQKLNQTARRQMQALVRVDEKRLKLTR